MLRARAGRAVAEGLREGGGGRGADGAGACVAGDGGPGGDGVGDAAEEVGAGAGAELREGPAEGAVVGLQPGPIRRVGRAEPAPVAEEPVARRAAGRSCQAGGVGVDCRGSDGRGPKG